MVNSKFCGSRSPCKTVEVRPSGKLLRIHFFFLA
jgi:hypothetical protein